MLQLGEIMKGRCRTFSLSSVPCSALDIVAHDHCYARTIYECVGSNESLINTTESDVIEDSDEDSSDYTESDQYDYSSDASEEPQQSPSESQIPDNDDEGSSSKIIWLKPSASNTNTHDNRYVIADDDDTDLDGLIMVRQGHQKKAILVDKACGTSDNDHLQIDSHDEKVENDPLLNPAWKCPFLDCAVCRNFNDNLQIVIRKGISPINSRSPAPFKFLVKSGLLDKEWNEPFDLQKWLMTFRLHLLDIHTYDINKQDLHMDVQPAPFCYYSEKQPELSFQHIQRQVVPSIYESEKQTMVSVPSTQHIEKREGKSESKERTSVKLQQDNTFTQASKADVSQPLITPFGVTHGSSTIPARTVRSQNVANGVCEARKAQYYGPTYNKPMFCADRNQTNHSAFNYHPQPTQSHSHYSQQSSVSSVYKPCNSADTPPCSRRVPSNTMVYPVPNAQDLFTGLQETFAMTSFRPVSPAEERHCSCEVHINAEQTNHYHNLYKKIMKVCPNAKETCQQHVASNSSSATLKEYCVQPERNSRVDNNEVNIVAYAMKAEPMPESQNFKRKHEATTSDVVGPQKRCRGRPRRMDDTELQPKIEAVNRLGNSTEDFFEGIKPRKIPAMLRAEMAAAHQRKVSGVVEEPSCSGDALSQVSSVQFQSTDGLLNPLECEENDQIQHVQDLLLENWLKYMCMSTDTLQYYEMENAKQQNLNDATIRMLSDPELHVWQLVADTSKLFS